MFITSDRWLCETAERATEVAVGSRLVASTMLGAAAPTLFQIVFAILVRTPSQFLGRKTIRGRVDVDDHATVTGLTNLVGLLSGHGKPPMKSSGVTEWWSHGVFC